MINKALFPGLLMGIGAVLAAAAALGLSPTPAGAQCEEPPVSSCASCHAREDPIRSEGEWHQIHCGQDICLSCHGGNGSSMDKELAHESMNARPLSDIYTDCHSCHPDYDERADRFASVLGVTPGCCATPTPVVESRISRLAPIDDTDRATGEGGRTPPLETAGLAAGSVSMMALFLMSIRWLDKH